MELYIVIFIGGGAGGVSGYSTSSSDPYKSYGRGIDTSVNINISSGEINGNIYRWWISVIQTI